MLKPPVAPAPCTHAFISAESDNKKAAAWTAGRYRPRFIVRSVAPTVQSEPRRRRTATANLPPGTEQIVHFRHGARALGVDTARVQSRRVCAPSPTYSWVIKMEMHAFGAGEALTELVL